MRIKMNRIVFLAAAPLALCACSTIGNEYGLSDYRYVPMKRVAVGNGNMSVSPPRPWNRKRSAFFTDIAETEDWTLNGPLLDGISFVTGLKEGRYLVRQDRYDAQKVPKFRSNMTPPEIAAMLESLYRVRGGAVEFKTLGIVPRPFLHTQGFQFDYEHLDGDELWRQGRVVGAVIDGRLYLIMMDAAKSH
jgi:hypothetical protein